MLRSLIAQKFFSTILNHAGLSTRNIEIIDKARFYYLLTQQGSAGFGKAFVEGAWTTDNLPLVTASLTVPHVIEAYPWIYTLVEDVRDRVHRLTTHPAIVGFMTHGDPTRVGAEHYDLSYGDFYSHLLGPTAKYTSAYWNKNMGEFDLDLFQKLDMDILCRRLELDKAPGLKVLEIGFGYGTLSVYMQQNYSASVTGLSISQGQIDGARNIAHKNDIAPEAQDFRLQDWKDLYLHRQGEFDEKYRGRYDRIVSVEMIEAVSTHDLLLFFGFLSDCLSPDGILVLQAINSPRLAYRGDGFAHEFIFPNGVVPQPAHMIHAAAKKGLVIVELDNSLGAAYAETLKTWYANFQKIDPENMIQYADFYASKGFKGQEKFNKIWQYYLEGFQGIFTSGYVTDGHFVFKKQSTVSEHKTLAIPQLREDIDRLLANKISPIT